MYLVFVHAGRVTEAAVIVDVRDSNLRKVSTQNQLVLVLVVWATVVIMVMMAAAVVVLMLLFSLEFGHRLQYVDAKVV